MKSNGAPSTEMVSVRMPAGSRAKIELMAVLADVTVTEWCRAALVEAIGREQPRARRILAAAKKLDGETGDEDGGDVGGVDSAGNTESQPRHDAREETDGA